MYRVGFININDMYNNDVGKESAQKFMKQTVVTGQTEGLRVGCGGMGGFKEWADGRV